MTVTTNNKIKKGICISKRYVNTVMGIATGDPEDLRKKFNKVDYVTQKVKEIYGI